MKHLFSLLLLFTITTAIIKAQDTLYLNSELKASSKKKNAAFFQVVTKTDTGYVAQLLNKKNELESITTYKDPELKILDGYNASYFGKAKGQEGRYLNGKRQGPWKYFRGDGSISGTLNYNNDVIVSAEYLKPNGDIETDPKKIEQLPSFPGGANAFRNYLNNTLRYPAQSREKRISGRVIVAFTVSPIGEILDVRISSGVNDELDREAMRVVRNMPRWNPGVQFNRPVRVAYVIPIAFALN
ncbi:MAG: energy transducer TonB [Daejeonella sp.]